MYQARIPDNSDIEQLRHEMAKPPQPGKPIMTNATTRSNGHAIAAQRFLMSSAVFVALATSTMAQTAGPPLVGVWKVVGWEAKTASNQSVKLYGDHPGGYYLFSERGHLMFTMIGNNREIPPSAAPTDAEIVKLYATMSAFDGTYKLEDTDKFVIHVEHSWNQSWTRTDQHREFKIDGNSLTVTFTTKNSRTGEDLLVKVSSERAE